LKSFKTFAISISILFTLIACSSINSNYDSAIQAAWVVLGENGQATARVITTAADCPALQQNGVTTPMQVRALPATEPLRRTISKPDQSKPSEFPVLTCELSLNSNTVSAHVGGRNLPLPKPVPLKIVVFGDTGCRLKLPDNFQACNDTDQWPFRVLAETAAEFKPDLVVHVGDYHYRENACPDGDMDCFGSAWGYGWDAWQEDFFAPAKALLSAAPWVMGRGNHESCSRAGQGWWRFMDPRPLQPNRDCNVESNDLVGDYSDPYAVPLGAGAQLIMFDSARVPFNPIPQTNPAYQIYLDQFKTADQLAQQANFSFVLTHHPILGLGNFIDADGQYQIAPGSVSLQDLLKTLYPQRLFNEHVQVLLAGHVHLFEGITFKSDHPTQFVSGNGGTALDNSFPAILPPGTTPYIDAVIADFKSSRQFGFTTLERTSATSTNWLIKGWSIDGELVATCFVSKRGSWCQ
jgi:hypothetical protein